MNFESNLPVNDDAIEAIADVVAKQRDTLAKTQASLLETLDSGHDKTEELEAIVA